MKNYHLPLKHQLCALQTGPLFRRVFIFGCYLCCLVLPPFFTAEISAEAIYRTQGEDGTVVFTDILPPNQQGETVELSPTNTQPILAPPKVAEEASLASTPPSSPYTEVSLVQPTNNQTIPPGQLDIVVQIALEPTLKVGHRIQFFMNNQTQGEPLAATSIIIGNLRRGSHTIRAQIVDENNQVIGGTNTATIHVKRTSIKHHKRESRWQLPPSS